MSTAEEQEVYGNFISDGNPLLVDLGFIPHEFYVWNETNSEKATLIADAQLQSWFLLGQEEGTAYNVIVGATTDLDNKTSFVDANGFRTFDGIEEQLEAAIVGTAITAASPAVVTMTAHGYSIGDVVRLHTTTAMLQVAGFDFVITAVPGANSFTLGGLPAAAFSAAATAVTARRIRVPQAYDPRRKNITLITGANPGVVTTGTNHRYSTDDRVRLRVPAINGMVELDEELVTVTRLSATTFSIGIDTTPFTTFVFPTSAEAAAGERRADVVPVGENGQDLTDAIKNESFQGIEIGSAVVGIDDDVMRFRAVRAAQFLQLGKQS